MKLAIKVLSVLALLASGFAYAQSVTFQHIVIIVQENRTPDNLFGSNPTFEPGVDIATTGVNSLGQTIPLAPIALGNCYEVIHGHHQFIRQYDKGKMDGADSNPIVPNTGCTVPPNPQFMYVDNSTGALTPYFDLAKYYGWANRMFQTNQGPSFPAHQFLFSGTSAPSDTSALFASDNPAPSGPVGCLAASNEIVPLINSSGQTVQFSYPCFDHATLSDVLENAPLGPISWTYYTATASSLVTAPNAISHICVPKTVNAKLTCTGTDWLTHVAVPQTRILTDVKNCKLPAVSWVTPNGPESDLPGGNTGLGPSWVGSIVNGIGKSTCGYWQNTAIIIVWDDWGGWYDHVPPFLVGGQPNGWGTSYVYGFRVPMIVVSAYTPKSYVDNSTHDFGSLLRFVESNFGSLSLIGPGTYADAYSDNLGAFFTLTTPRPFMAVPAPVGANYFLTYPFAASPLGPDPDGDQD